MDQDNTARIIDLLEKEQSGSLTAEEEKELRDLVPSNGLGGATENQKEYIGDLLDKLGADLSDYWAYGWEDMDYDAASELIDQLKEEVTEAGAWND